MKSETKVITQKTVRELTITLTEKEAKILAQLIGYTDTDVMYNNIKNLGQTPASSYTDAIRVTCQFYATLNNFNNKL